MTCRDCVHYEVCLPNSQAYGHKLKICTKFKNKADFIGVKHGEWKKYRVTEGHVFVCSLCDYRTLVDFEGEFLYHNYCPKCGADMRKGGADNGEIH